GYGTVFKITTNGALTTILSFDHANGANPYAPLLRASDGYFYGTTFKGGAYGGGTIFRLIPLVQFTNMIVQPEGSLLLGGIGPTNQGFRLWASTDPLLPFASWNLLTSNTFNSAGTFTYTDTDAATNASRFYRLSVP